MVCVSLKCKNENFTEKFVNQKLNKFHFYCNAVYIIFGKIKYNNFFIWGGGGILFHLGYTIIAHSGNIGPNQILIV